MSKRTRFFLGHLVTSITILIIALSIVFFVWYPGSLAKAFGVQHLILMLVLIDVVIGPLFGWLVYKEGKKTLKFDLFVVLALQASAFLYGMYAIAQGRPAWIIYDSMAFHAVKQSAINKDYINLATSDFNSTSLFKIKYGALQLEKERDKIRALPKGTIALNHPMYYKSLKDAEMNVRPILLSFDILEKYNSQQEIDAIKHKYPTADAWMGLVAPYKDMVVLMNKSSFEVVAIVDLNPWPSAGFK